MKMFLALLSGEGDSRSDGKAFLASSVGASSSSSSQLSKKLVPVFDHIFSLMPINVHSFLFVQDFKSQLMQECPCSGYTDVSGKSRLKDRVRKE